MAASPNYDARGDAPVDMLVFHYTGMASCAEARARLCSPEAKVSAHWLVDEDGATEALAPESARAWHAGVAYWRGARDVNARSIGVEIHNGGHDFGLPPFPDAQIEAVIALARGILAREPGITPRGITSHAEIAPTRRMDPGERFPWARLAQAGIGWWAPPPAPAPPDENPEAVARARDGLRAWGMELAPHGGADASLRAALTAFQRRFRPARVDGRVDASTLAALDALLRAV